MNATKISILAIAVITPLLCHCVIEEGGSNRSSNVSGSAMKSQSVYEKGVHKGQHDGRSGLSRNPARYNGTYPAAESDAFFMGYEKGYNKGIH